MKSKFYRLRRGRMISGVLAGLSDKFDFDVNLVRFLFAMFTIFNFGLGIVLYIIFAISVPYKEDVEKERFGTGPRRRKEAEVIKDNYDGWFW